MMKDVQGAHSVHCVTVLVTASVRACRVSKQSTRPPSPPAPQTHITIAALIPTDPQLVIEFAPVGLVLR